MFKQVFFNGVQTDAYFSKPLETLYYEDIGEIDNYGLYKPLVAICDCTDKTEDGLNKCVVSNSIGSFAAGQEIFREAACPNVIILRVEHLATLKLKKCRFKKIKLEHKPEVVMREWLSKFN